MLNVELKHTNDLQKFRDQLIKKAATDVMRKVVSKNTMALYEEARKRAVFKGHWGWIKGVGRAWIKPTGYLKRSITPMSRDMGLTGVVSPYADYAMYVELGTRYMAAQPFLFPALLQIKPQFLKEMKQVVKLGT
jgi:HK97 gp10 family phage protein